MLCDNETCWIDVVPSTQTIWETYTQTFTSTITAYNGTTKVATLSTPVNISRGENAQQSGQKKIDVTSTYSIKGTTFLMSQGTSSQVVPTLSTDEYGNFNGIFQVPAGTFEEGDVIGYLSGGTFIPTARVLSVTKLSGNSVRLYVSSDAATAAYSTTNYLGNARFNENGVYVSNTAFGIYSSAASSQISLSGKVIGTSGGTSGNLPG